jgi:hypothetical protein
MRPALGASGKAIDIPQIGRDGGGPEADAAV